MDKVNGNALLEAAICGELAAVTELVSLGTDVDYVWGTFGGAPVSSAAGLIRIEIVVHFSLQKFGAIGSTNGTGWTPLMFAAFCGHMEVVRFLVREGADKNKPDRMGWTPLLIAAGKDHLEVVRFLVREGADKDKANINEETPLIAAAKSDHLEVVKFLVEEGADMDKANINGRTPLMEVVRMSGGRLSFSYQNYCLGVVQSMVAGGADKELSDSDGRTAYDIYKQSHRKGDVAWLTLLIDKKTKDRGFYLDKVSTTVINTASVVATLVVTLSYTTLSSPPGGWSVADSSNPERPIEDAAAGESWLVAFSFLNAAAMFSSLLALLLLLSLHLLQFAWSSHSDKTHKGTKHGRQALENDFIGSALVVGLCILMVSVLCLFAVGIAGPFVAFLGHEKYALGILIFPCLAVEAVLFGMFWLQRSGLLKPGTFSPTNAVSRGLKKLATSKPSLKLHR